MPSGKWQLLMQSVSGHYRQPHLEVSSRDQLKQSLVDLLWVNFHRRSWVSPEYGWFLTQVDLGDATSSDERL
ncbi:MAG: hypothetical protein CM15mP77_2910 [Synechococcus sp.]|nr:MAG: hypothetical protein CM15mP77_2910 [Synechococcus sp.]